jgi:predicted CXXCH cytochrome family protein
VDITSDGKTADDLPLFTNHLTATPAVNEPFVECASCHNPHGTTNQMFLRASTDNSAICTACHVK